MICLNRYDDRQIPPLLPDYANAIYDTKLLFRIPLVSQIVSIHDDLPGPTRIKSGPTTIQSRMNTHHKNVI